MSHTLYKKPITDTETRKDDEKLIIFTRSKIEFHYIVKKLFSSMRRQITVLQFVALLIIICITLLLLAQNSAESSYTEINIEPDERREQTSPKYAFSFAHVKSEIITPRVIMSRNQKKNVRRELNARKRQLSNVCETISLKKSYLEVALTNMIIDTEHNVSWCPIYKAASSKWMSYFAVLKGIQSDAVMDMVQRDLLQLNEIIKQKFRHDEDLNIMHEKLIKTKKFLIVRHPLERLLSAYRDKLEHMKGREYYYRRFGRHIVFKYRLPGNETRLEPTFEEFLRFIVKEKFFDEHWVPYYQACEPCAIHYDYILKFEILDREEDFFIQDVNLSKHLYDRHYVRNVNPHGMTTRETLKKYIEKIPQSLLEEIYKIYENDYKLFDYSFV